MATSAPTTTEATETDDLLENLLPLDPEMLTNFTMAHTVTYSGVPDTQDSAVQIDVQQASIDNYHLRQALDEQVITEAWLVDGVSYANLGDGQVLQIETPVVTPADMILTVTTFENTPGVQRVGDDTIEGRAATHYRIEGADYLITYVLPELQDVSDITGGSDFWVDNEQHFQIKAEGEVTWTNADGSPGSVTYAYAVTQIGSTPAVSAPE